MSLSMSINVRCPQCPVGVGREKRKKDKGAVVVGFEIEEQRMRMDRKGCWPSETETVKQKSRRQEEGRGTTR